MMLCCPLDTTTKADDVLAVMSTFFEENNLSWDRLFDVCTDGVPTMLGPRSGFVTKIIASFIVKHLQHGTFQSSL